MTTPDDPAFRVVRAHPQYHRTRTGRYLAPYRGVRLVAPAAHALAPVDALLPLLPPGAAFSGRTAARLLGLPLPVRFTGSDDPRPQVMADARAGRTIDVDGVQCRLCLLPPAHVVLVDGRPVTSPARTFLDLASVLQVWDLVAVGDVVLRRGLASPSELTAVLDWAGRRRGVRTARVALPLLVPTSRSPQESRLRAHLQLSVLPDPEPNAVVTDSDGGFLAEGDLVWREYKLIVEYDGRVHLSERQRRKDAVRRNRLVREGWLHLVYTADVLARHPDRIRAEIASALRERGWTPPPDLDLGI